LPGVVERNVCIIWQGRRIKNEVRLVLAPHEQYREERCPEE
jgi:hypothetical protein